jgi:hypothetical protein
MIRLAAPAPHRAGHLFIDAATVMAGVAVGLLVQVNAWLAVAVGLAACACLYLAAVRVRRDRRPGDTRSPAGYDGSGRLPSGATPATRPGGTRSARQEDRG